MFSLLKYGFIALALIAIFSYVKHTRSTATVGAVTLLEYVYHNKLHETDVSCEEKVYKTQQFVKCNDVKPTFWRINEGTSLKILAVNSHAAKLVGSLDDFKELGVDKEKIGDSEYKRALELLFSVSR